jgi:phosphatidylglycerophosphate synthase
MMPIGKAIARTGITPNMITGLTVLVALVSAWFFAMGDLLVGLLFMILTVVMDMFDGAVARAAGLVSKFGATFDHTLDRYAEYLFMLGLMIGPISAVTIPWWPYVVGDTFIPWFWGFFTLFGMIMASFARAKARKAHPHYSWNFAVGSPYKQHMDRFLAFLTAIDYAVFCIP